VGPIYDLGMKSQILDSDAVGCGEISSYGRNVFMGYIWDEKKTEEATHEIDGDVWYRTGDIGR
jgi:long-subunit acyl-CoA synthetase (AMP-forming)